VEFGNPYAVRLVVGDTAASFLEIGPAAAAGSAGQDVAALRLRTGAATPTLDLLSIFYDDYLASVQVQGGATAHALQVRADGNVSMYSRAPAASGQDFPGVSLYAENGVGANPQKLAYLHLYSGAGVGSHARLIGQVNDADGKGTISGNVPLIPGSTRQIYAQAGVAGGTYTSGVGGATVTYPAFPNATIAAIAQWGASGGVFVSTYGFAAAQFRAQCFTAAGELGTTGMNLQWMAWGY